MAKNFIQNCNLNRDEKVIEQKMTHFQMKPVIACGNMSDTERQKVEDAVILCLKHNKKELLNNSFM